jgi:hypothetical protein
MKNKTKKGIHIAEDDFVGLCGQIALNECNDEINYYVKTLHNNILFN